MKTSTNALTKRWAESKGWLCDTVQRFYGGKRHDLFGIVDSIIVRPGVPSVILVQNCSYGSRKAHKDEIDSLPMASVKQALTRSSASLWVLEWRRKKAKRGGKRLTREWYLRGECAEANGWGWTPLWPGWEGPIDLYPKKTTKTPIERGEVRTWTKPRGMP